MRRRSVVCNDDSKGEFAWPVSASRCRLTYDSKVDGSRIAAHFSLAAIRHQSDQIVSIRVRVANILFPSRYPPSAVATTTTRLQGRTLIQRRVLSQFVMPAVASGAVNALVSPVATGYESESEGDAQKKRPSQCRLPTWAMVCAMMPRKA